VCGGFSVLKTFLEDDSRKNELYKQAYRLIHKQKRVSKADLIKAMQAKPTTMTRILDELLHKGLIKEGGLGPSSGGRPPILYEINERAARIIGVDISRTAVRVVLTDLNFAIAERHVIPMTKNHTPDVVFAEIRLVIAKWLRQHEIAFDQLLGIGVGAVGPILWPEGILVNPESFLSDGWDHVHVASMLSGFPVRILVDNGANSGAASEFYMHGEMYRHILYCISGFGIRGGFLYDGKVFYKGKGDAGALGHVIVQADGKVCVCGRQGCLTAYSSYRAMLDEYKRMAGKEVVFDQFLKLVKSGERTALFIAKKAAWHLGIGLANMMNALRPELVVLHGTLVYETDFFFEETVSSARSHLFLPQASSSLFKKGSLKEEAVAMGAAIQVFDSYF
jgi:predicted NBD/HSP70 family sugar kinase